MSNTQNTGRVGGVNFEKLVAAVEWSIQRLGTPRKNRIEAVKQLVGMHYSDDGADQRVPTNFLELASTIYSRQLAARAPRVLVTAKNQKLRPHAMSMELALNQLPDELGMNDTMHKAVIEALFSFAVVKVGICSSGKEVLGYDYGEPFIDLVDLDDYFCDMSVKIRKRMQFEGNDYWVSLDVAREMYTQGDPAELKADEHTHTNDQGDDRAESISSEGGADLYDDRVWLRDVWLPAERKMVTYGVVSKKLFRVVDWDGPGTGPYITLGFSDVPGNLLPLPPVALWRDLHELGNAVFRKLGKQADNRKTVALFAGGNDESVDRLKSARDGDGITYTGQKPEQLTMGGIDQATLLFYSQLRDINSYFAGNLDTMGGLAPQTDTLGQDAMLAEAANARLKHMKAQVYEFAKSIFKVLAWYEWTDPERKRLIAKTLPGTDISIDLTWSKETRRGEFVNYNFDIDVFSMQDDSPETKLQKVAMALERFIFPVLPQLEAQGAHLDLKSMIELVAKLSDLPELNRIVVFDEKPEEPPVAGNPEPEGERSYKPAVTTRRYERVNRPGATRPGKTDVMARLLAGGNVQESEGATLGRAVS